jgi:hypothetical protein
MGDEEVGLLWCDDPWEPLFEEDAVGFYYDG